MHSVLYNANGSSSSLVKSLERQWVMFDMAFSDVGGIPSAIFFSFFPVSELDVKIG